MQAIQTKWIPATNTKPYRLKAWCERGSVTISQPDEVTGERAHVYAADKLVEKFVSEDEKRYAGQRENNPWSTRRVCGGLPDGTMAHVFAV